jgi:hypothetical protein
MLQKIKRQSRAEAVATYTACAECGSEDIADKQADGTCRCLNPECTRERLSQRVFMAPSAEFIWEAAKKIGIDGGHFHEQAEGDPECAECKTHTNHLGMIYCGFPAGVRTPTNRRRRTRNTDGTLIGCKRATEVVSARHAKVLIELECEQGS